MPSLQRQRWARGAGVPIPNAGLEKPDHLDPGSSTSSGIPETTAFHLWRTHSWEVSQSCQFGFPSGEGKDTLGIFIPVIYVSAPPLHFHEPKLQEFISVVWPLTPSRTTMKWMCMRENEYFSRTRKQFCQLARGFRWRINHLLLTNTIILGLFLLNRNTSRWPILCEQIQTHECGEKSPGCKAILFQSQLTTFSYGKH